MNFNHNSIEKYKLENDLDVVLYRDNDIPLVTVNLWYKVGSASEVKEKTGLTHLFEHMMFQGSKNVNKGEHFKYIQEAGGMSNASTNFDRTNYYEKVPSNFVDLALWLESDRMGFFIDALTQEKLSNQIDVIKNERLERYDNQPYGLAWETILSNLFSEEHPYHAPTIGWMEDILNYNLDDVATFFRTHYNPSNASLVVAGDIEFESVKAKIENYFGKISSIQMGNKDYEIEATLKETKRIILQDNVQLERLYLCWKSQKYFEKMDDASEFLSDLLAGSKNGRLHKELVFDKQVAISVSSFQFSGKHDGFFGIIVTAKPGISLDFLKTEVFKILEEIFKNGITERERIRSLNGIKSGFIFALQNMNTLADRFNHYNFYLDNPNGFDFDINRFESLTNDEIKEAAQLYLNQPFIELHIIPNKNT
ncbi:MAG: pitrilysin family protein [Ignavibacteria bacterium]|jgi:zinc protease|nr:pitrilysin family protein [Ignavibacteria bacterium]